MINFSSKVIKGLHEGQRKTSMILRNTFAKEAQDLQHLKIFSENKLNNLKINLMARIRKRTQLDDPHFFFKKVKNGFQDLNTSVSLIMERAKK